MKKDRTVRVTRIVLLPLFIERKEAKKDGVKTQIKRKEDILDQGKLGAWGAPKKNLQEKSYKKIRTEKRKTEVWNKSAGP